MMRTFLCFDIGGSKYNVGLLRQDGTILARQKSLWHGHSQQEMLAELFCAGHAVLAQCPGQAPCAAGATIPGLADAASGMWVEASFSGIRNVPIAHLSRSLACPPPSRTMRGRALWPSGCLGPEKTWTIFSM